MAVLVAREVGGPGAALSLRIPRHFRGLYGLHGATGGERKLVPSPGRGQKLEYQTTHLLRLVG